MINIMESAQLPK